MLHVPPICVGFMRSLSFVLLICLANSIVVMAQSWGDVKSNPSLYYYGEGWGTTLKDADDQALASLISQISVNISVSSSQDNKREEKDGKLVSDNTMFQASIQTFSNATLTNTTRVEIDPAPNAHVGRWIRRSEVDKIWDTRRVKFREMIDAAERAKEKGKVDVALRNYFWALTLVKSMQKSNSESYNGHLLMTWIPEQMEDILDEIKIRTINKGDNGDVELFFTYKNRPVNSLDFKYADGGFWSNICSVKDGYGLVEFTPGDIPDDFELEVEFEYRGQAKLDPELASVLAFIPEFKLKSSGFRVKNTIEMTDAKSSVSSLSSEKVATSAQAIMSDVYANAASVLASTSFTEIDPEFFKRPETVSDVPEEYLGAMDAITQAIKTKNYSSVRGYFTEECYGIFNKLVKYGQAKIVGNPHMTFYRNGDMLWGKGLKLSFSFNSGVKKNFTEDIVFSFNKDAKVCNMAFGLGETAEDDIMGQSAYPEKARMILVDFLQNYQTAFALKRLDYIDKIFDEDALIIVANKLQPKSGSINDALAMALGDKYEYHRYSKSEYINKLRTSFASKEFINLRFNDTKVRRAAVGGEIYGVQLEQDYFSNNYSDHGYLFLEINLNNPEEPTIFVRTWQPNPDPEFGLYGLDSFRIQQVDDEY